MYILSSRYTRVLLFLRVFFDWPLSNVRALFQRREVRDASEPEPRVLRRTVVQEPDSHLDGLVAAVPRASGCQVGCFSQLIILQSLTNVSRPDSGSLAGTADMNNPLCARARSYMFAHCKGAHDGEWHTDPMPPM